jgi:DNA polymerase-3 subunit beta
MKFEVAKPLFYEALQIAMNAVPAKSTLQILNNFLFNLEGNVLEICATDLDLGVRIKLEVNGAEDGKIVVNARDLTDIIKDQEDAPVVFVVNDYLINLKVARYECRLTGFDASEFPQIAHVEGNRCIELTGQDLAFLAEKTLFAVSQDVTRLALNGVCMEHTDNLISLTATDGTRLGHARVDYESESWVDGVILPPKALHYVLKIAKHDQQVDVKIDDGFAQFSTENVQIFTKLLDGPYPKYQNVIPVDFSKTAVFNKDTLQRVVRRVAALAYAKNKQVILNFLSDSQAEAYNRNQDKGGESREDLATRYEGEEGFKISFNANYLLEILKMCPADEVRLKMNNQVGACILEPVGEGMPFYFLLMPLRLTDGL